MTVFEWLKMAEARLRAAGVDSSRLEAQVLAAHVLLVDRSWLLAHPEHEFPDLAGEVLLQRRERREPLAYITGRREFFGRPFRVTPAVLIPRQETETLVETALSPLLRFPRETSSTKAKPTREERARGGGPETSNPRKTTANDEASNQFPPPQGGGGAGEGVFYQPEGSTNEGKKPLDALDIGTGSGAIAITLKLERPDWRLTAVDVSPEALEVARQNAERLGADVRFVLSDAFAELLGESFDLIVTNPPYIGRHEPLAPEVGEHEPALALYGGETGLEFYQRLAREAPAHLNDGGLLMMEVGYRQAEAVRTLFEAAGWRYVETVKDLTGVDRVVVVRHPWECAV